MSSISKNFIVNFLWQVSGQFGYLIISLIGNIVLARLLEVYEFGIIGILLFFVSLFKVFSESGLSGALIRKGQPTDVEYSTIFIFNLIVSLCCYILLFFAAPFIADFYENEKLVLYLRIIGIVLIINGFQFTQYTRLIVQLQYKRISLYAIIAVAFATIFGIILAVLDYGVWSLIAMQILNVLFLTIIYWYKEGGYQKMVFSRDSFLSMYKFGMYTTLSSILNTAFENSYQLILGKYFSITTTGFYYQGKKLQEIPIGIIKSATTGVVFSTLSKARENQEEFSKIYTSIVVAFTVLVGCICLNLYLFSKEVVLILYGEKWIEATFFIKLLSIASFFFMQEMFNRNIFKVFDKTERVFILEIIKKSIQAISIVIGVISLDIKILMYGFVVTNALSFFINYWESRKIFKNNNGVFLEFFVAIKIFALMAFLGLTFEYVLDYINIKPILKLLIFAPTITALFLLFIQIFKIVELKKIITSIKKIKKK